MGGGRTSLDTSSHAFLAGSSSQMGGGSYSSYLMEHLVRMHKDIKSTTRKLELEQRRLFNLDKTLAIAESEWATKMKGKKKKDKPETEEEKSSRGRMQSTDSTVEGKAEVSIGMKAEAVRALEKKLVRAIEDLNKGNCENEQLREAIDQLRKERTILDSVFKTMAKDISGNEKLLEKQKIKYHESKEFSEAAKQRTRALNKMLDKERRLFKDKNRERQKKLLNENEVSNSFHEQEREVGGNGKMQEMAGKGKNRRTYVVADEEENFSEPAMHRRILKLSFLNTIQRRHIRQHQKNIEVFEQAFATIKSSTGISDIEEIVKIFHTLEQRNFSLLTYVNQLNREIETIEIRNRELQTQLVSHKSEYQQTAVRKDEAISELSVQIQKTQAATEEKKKNGRRLSSLPEPMQTVD